MQPRTPGRARRVPFRWLAPACIVASAGCLVYAWLFNAINPDVDGTALALLAFGALFISSFWVYPAVGLGVGVVASTLLRQRRWAIAGGAPLALGLAPSLLTLPLGSHTPTGDTLCVMSANLCYGRGDVDRLFEQIDRIAPDVLLLQEYTDEFAARAGDRLHARFPHAIEVPAGDAFGQAVFSSFPFVAKPRIYPASKSRPNSGWPAQIHAEIDVNGTRVAIMNVHLLPPAGVQMVIDQHRMADGLAESLASSDRPAILAGDFNSSERGLPMRRVLNAGFRSVHREGGLGIGATWPRLGALRHLPGTRLDHVLFREGSLRLIEQGVGRDFASDHRPVWARFEVVRN
ncbi:MAG: endonuclease/exonuclease/phosphatase family protein [Phycisphaerales bacterium]|nr:endonuclease/exonuclease/phosphatase family protein [Phycisphaerales bacterium]